MVDFASFATSTTTCKNHKWKQWLRYYGTVTTQTTETDSVVFPIIGLASGQQQKLLKLPQNFLTTIEWNAKELDGANFLSNDRENIPNLCDTDWVLKYSKLEFTTFIFIWRNKNHGILAATATGSTA